VILTLPQWAPFSVHESVAWMPTAVARLMPRPRLREVDRIAVLAPLRRPGPSFEGAISMSFGSSAPSSTRALFPGGSHRDGGVDDLVGRDRPVECSDENGA
jgi:hypothetical protein